MTMTNIETERVEHGFIVLTRPAPEARRTIVVDLDAGDEAGKATQYPFIGDQGQVGLCLKHEDGRVEYIYFNTSEADSAAGPGGGPGFNTFVYVGTEGTPEEDDPEHFYYLFDPANWDEPTSVNES